MAAVLPHRNRHHRRLALKRRFVNLDRYLAYGLGGILLVWTFVTVRVLQQVPVVLDLRATQQERSSSKLARDRGGTCSSHPPLSILKDLTEEQRNPRVGHRWMVRPPQGGNLHLMCCDTTKGSFHVLLHEKWAPIGVPHLLNMLDKGYFETTIPLFRCTDACQFGLSANKTLTKEFDRRPSIPDDPLWLPTGPEHRFSSQGKNKIKRYPKGVLTHAGAGANSRGVQLVLTLKANKFMGGGSPWEVPLGEVVEANGSRNKNNTNDGGFVDVSLPDVYTGYGEKGPGQGLLKRKGVTKEVREKWPLLDYMLHCAIVDRFIVDDTEEKREQ